MRVNQPGFIGRLRPWGWWVIAPTAAIVALMLLLTGGTGTATASQPRVLLTTVLFQEQQPMCQSCHPKEYADWKGAPHAKATLDPVFQEQLAKSQNQAACLACHTTGFDTGSGKFLSEGVTCEACHGPYKAGHPAAATMQLPMASETCRMCHLDTFKQWETSKHGAKNIECFDCHMAHTQGLRLGSQEKLCGACHSDQTTAAAHATHGIKGVDCETCHMAQAAATTGASMGQKPARDHSFKVGSDVCAGCHKGTIHNVASPSGGTSGVSLPLDTKVGTMAQQAPAAAVSAGDAPELQKRVETLRDVAVTSMGLAFGAGGFLGLVAGVVGMTLMRKRGAE
jgi:hypothetical protein